MTCSKSSGSVPDRNGDACLIYVLTDIDLAIGEGCFGHRSRRTKSHASRSPVWIRRLQGGGRSTPNTRVRRVLKRLLFRISISMGLPERIKKILAPDPVILRRVAGRMRGTMYHFMELFDTLRSGSTS